jgi:molybdate transport repressor ModE-like protein
MNSQAQIDRVSRRLKLKDLHTLQTVATVGSMAKAARQLSISQPTISKAIADMEQVLGASLLERSARGVELTDTGRILLARSRVVFDEIEQGVREIGNASDPTRGEVRIGTAEPLTVVVSEIISRLSAKHPFMTFQVVVNEATTLLRNLRERSLDVVLTRWAPSSQAADVATEMLFDSSLAVLASKDHALARRKKLSLIELMDERWTLSPPDSYLGRIVVDAFRRKKLALPSSVVTTVSIYMRLNLLASGRFISIMPTTLLEHRSNSEWLRALDVKLGEAGPIAAVTLKGRRATGALTLFQQMSRAVCQGYARQR